VQQLGGLQDLWRRRVGRGAWSAAALSVTEQQRVASSVLSSSASPAVLRSGMSAAVLSSSVSPAVCCAAAVMMA
jgi:hypothetical protein